MSTKVADWLAYMVVHGLHLAQGSKPFNDKVIFYQGVLKSIPSIFSFQNFKMRHS